MTSTSTAAPRSSDAAPTLQGLAPVLLVEAIEPCLPFWVERLGFERHAEVTEGDRLGFVLLLKDGVSVMLQSRASLEQDLPQLAVGPFAPTTVLYLHVADLDAVERQLEGLPLEVPRRETFYGATEVGVRDPGGTLVLFAQRQC